METNETKNTNVTTETENTQEQTSEQVTMTRDELDALIQSTADKRVSQALKTAEKKNADKLREAQKLANMDAVQKYEYELEQKDAELREREQKLLMAENRNECAKILADKGMSIKLVDFVVDADAEVMNDRIKSLDKIFKDMVKNEVTKRLGSKAPVQTPVADTLTKEQFKKLSLAQKQAIATNNPELWNEMTK